MAKRLVGVYGLVDAHVCIHQLLVANRVVVFPGLLSIQQSLLFLLSCRGVRLEILQFFNLTYCVENVALENVVFVLRCAHFLKSLASHEDWLFAKFKLLCR